MVLKFSDLKGEEFIWIFLQLLQLTQLQNSLFTLLSCTFTGLSSKEIEESRRKWGSNELPRREAESFWAKLRDNFDDPLIRILCAALLVTCALAVFGYAEWSEGMGIALSVCTATFVATYSEFKNEEAFQNLQAKASHVQVPRLTFSQY